MICGFCHQKITETKIHIRDECPACGRDLHICLNCQFYDTNAHRQCRESIREPVQDKERANYCDFFSPSARDTVQGDSASDAIKKLQDLFK